MPRPAMKRPADHVERALDAALEMTFPASDPVAVFVPGEEGPVAMRIKRRSLLLAGMVGAAILGAPPSGQAASSPDPAPASPAATGYSADSLHVMKYYETARL